MKKEREVEWIEKVIGQEFETQSDQASEMIHPDAVRELRVVFGVLTQNDWAEIGLEVVTRAGRFSRRVASRFYKEYSVKLSDSEIEMIGNVAARYTRPAERHIVRVDRELWTPGLFGDDGSCFYQSRRAAPHLIFDSGGAAVKLYDTQHNPRARAWLVPVEGRGVLFNVYTVDGARSMSTRSLADVLVAAHSPFPSFQVKDRIGVSNMGEEGGTVWINNGRGTLICPPDLGMCAYSRIDLRISLDALCCRCGDFAGEDWTEWEDRRYCARCSPIRACAGCGERTHENYIWQLDGNAYCRGCYTVYARRCHECHNDYHRRDMHYRGSHVWVCARCDERSRALSRSSARAMGRIYTMADGWAVDVSRGAMTIRDLSGEFTSSATTLRVP